MGAKASFYLIARWAMDAGDAPVRRDWCPRVGV